MSEVAALGRPFWVLWSASTATNLGDGIRLVALPLLATRLTTDPALIALVTVFTFLPALLFGQIAGVLVDRLRKRPLIVVAHFARALVLTVVTVAIWAGTLNLLTLCIAAFLYGIGEALADPASHAMLPQLVPPQSLAKANSNLQSGMIIAQMFVGRAAGGVLFASAHSLPILANVLLLAAAGAAMVRIGDRETLPARTASSRGPVNQFFHELREGIAAVTSSRLLARMSLLLSVWAAVSGAFWGVAVVYALRDLESGASGFGVMLALAAVGSLLGAQIAVAVFRSLGAATVTLIATIVSSGSVIGLAWTNELWVAALLLALNGLAVTVWNIMSVTVRQVAVDPGMLGRVSSTYTVLARLTMPLGAGLAGLLAAVAGVPVVFLASGLLLLIASAVLLPALWGPCSEIWPAGQSSAQISRASR